MHIYFVECSLSSLTQQKEVGQIFTAKKNFINNPLLAPQKVVGHIFTIPHLQYKRSRFTNVSGGNGLCCSRKLSFWNPSVGLLSIESSALLWSVTQSSSLSWRGGMSLIASSARSWPGEHIKLWKTLDSHIQIDM